MTFYFKEMLAEIKNPKTKLEARKRLLEIPFIITLMRLKLDHKESPEMKVCFQKRKWKLIIQSFIFNYILLAVLKSREGMFLMDRPTGLNLS